MMTFESYRLPSGELVNVDATAAKAELFITFQLKGGQVVTAERMATRHEAEARLRAEYAK